MFYIKKPKIILSTLILLVFTSCLWRSYTRAKPQVIPGALLAGDRQCTRCHEKWYENIKKSAHKILFKDKNACESCHGLGSRHVASQKDPALVFIFKNMKNSRISQICLKCHDDDSLDAYLDFRHFKKGVSCVSCHKVHGNRKDKLLVKTEPGLCFICHPKVKESFLKKHGHDVYSPRMLCSGCHGKHNSVQIVGDESRTRSLCIVCHSSIEEEVARVTHQPVEESCTRCHAYHGSDFEKILVIGMPHLCYPCHNMKNHKIPIAKSLPMGPQGTSKCTVCHVKIHGGPLEQFYENMGPPPIIDTNFIWVPNVNNIPSDAPIRNIPNAPQPKEVIDEGFGNDSNF